MKLSHLSLAILSAIALAACGGSGSDDHTTDPNANKPGATDQTPKQPEDKKDDTAKKDDAKIVDPTGDQVVDNISLAETSTTASQQYLRGAKSGFDRAANPNEPASATVLSGITLDKQNPQLTNIVIGRIDDKNSKGERVQVAFYAGSDSNQMQSVRTGNAISIYPALQTENENNVLIGYPSTAFESNEWFSNLGFKAYAGSEVMGSYRTILDSPLMANSSLPAVSSLYNNYVGAQGAVIVMHKLYEDALDAYLKAANEYIKNKTPIDPTVIKQLENTESNLTTFVDQLRTDQKALVDSSDFKKLGIKTIPQNKLEVVNIVNVLGTKIDKPTKALLDTAKVNLKDFDIPNSLSPDSLAKYGYGLHWYTLNGNITGDAGWGDRVDSVKGVVGVEAGDAVYPDAALPTNGLVGIYKNGGEWIVRGSEDNNVRTTRIFGHYYLDPGSVDNQRIKLNPESFNSWMGATTFITGLDAKDSPNQYGLGVEPMTLNHVQYGRVTATIDGNSVAGRQGTSGWVKEHQDFANRNPKYDDNADDFYFYRGTNATSIENMAKLPTDANITYLGHALMYGIDNSFHGAGQELPNAFGNQQSYGIGNFVKANLNMGSKKFDGYVYNVWGTPTSAAVKEDKLVEFSGDVTGNTVIGTANLAYDTSKTGDLRASFYGAAADEVGGAFNSVKREDPYGPIGWGGVFGAHKTTSGNSAWLVSSEKK